MHPFLSINLIFFASTLPAYATFLTLAAIATAVGAWFVAARHGLPARATAIVIASMTVAGFFGARLLHVATHWAAYQAEPWRIATLNFNGLAIFGGFGAALLAGVLVSRWLRVDIVRLSDSIVLPLGVGIAVARIGCFLNGCCFGRTTNLPWGVTYPVFSEPHLYQLAQGSGTGLFSVAAMHPTQLYDAAVAISGVVLIWLLARRRWATGSLLAIFIAWYSLGRFLLQPLRVTMPSEDAPLWFYPSLFLLAAFVSLIALRPCRRTKLN